MEHSDDAPTGLPPEEPEETPLGVAEGDPARGPEAMPGIPDDGEPPQAG